MTRNIVKVCVVILELIFELQKSQTGRTDIITQKVPIWYKRILYTNFEAIDASMH